MPDRLTALDATFLNFERTHTPMHVAGLYIFSGTPELSHRPGLPGLFQAVEERLPLVPRYRQRVVPVPFGLGHPLWVDDPEFDLSYHLRRSAVPSPGGMGDLLEYVARVHARPLDRSRPLWEMYLIEGLEGGRMALYSKVHHAMIDGVSGVDLATLLLDFEPEGRAIAAGPLAPAASPPGPVELVAGTAAETAAAGLRLLRTALSEPAHLPRRLLEQLDATTQIGNLTRLLRPVPSGPINVPVGAHRRIAVVEIPLARAKAIKNALGGTVNDVVLAAFGEALHAFLEHRGEPSAARRYRVMVPVSVRDESERMALGNRVAAMFMEMPVGPMPARRRLAEVTAEMQGLKEKRQALAADRLIEMTSWTPATLHVLAGRLSVESQRFVNTVLSNVPGVQAPMYAGGARLLEAYPLLPLAANVAVVTCVTSYNGGLYFGVVADRDAIPDIDVLAGGIRSGFDRLEAEALAKGPASPAPPGRARRPASSRRPPRAAARRVRRGSAPGAASS